MTTPEYSDSVFVLDAEAGLTNDNRWRDLGPHGLHATPIGYAAPGWGFGRTRKGTAYVGFDGATQSWTLPLDFYRWAPDTSFSLVVAARFNAPVVNDNLFSCVDVGNNNGIRLYLAPSGEQARLIAYSGGVSSQVQSTAALPLTGRTRVFVLTMDVSFLSVMRRLCMMDALPVAATVSGAALASVGYGTTTTVRIGSSASGGRHDGDIFLIGMWPRILSNIEAVDYSSMLRDRT